MELKCPITSIAPKKLFSLSIIGALAFIVIENNPTLIEADIFLSSTNFFKSFLKSRLSFFLSLHER